MLVEALLATPGSGVRLAPLWQVIVGADDLADQFPHRPPIDRGEFNTTDVHPIDRAFDALRRALREHAAAEIDQRQQ